MTTTQRPTLITVVCILSWVYIGISLIGSTIGLKDGPLSPEEIEASKSEMLGMYTEEQIEIMRPFLEQVFVMLDNVNDKYWTITLINLAGALIGLQGVIMMFRMKKSGYYLYVLYTLMPIGLAIAFYPGFVLTIVLIWHLIFGGLFLILYGTKLKYMK